MPDPDGGDSPYASLLALHHAAARAADSRTVTTADELTAIAIATGFTRDGGYMVDLAVIGDAEDAVAAAEAGLAAAQSALVVAHAALEAASAGDGDGEVDQAAVASAEAAVDNAEAAVASAEASVTAARTALRAAHAKAAAGLQGRHQGGAEYHEPGGDADHAAFRH